MSMEHFWRVMTRSVTNYQMNDIHTLVLLQHDDMKNNIVFDQVIRYINIYFTENIAS